MAAARTGLNPTTLSTGFTAKLVTVTSVSEDGLTALTTDRQNTETRVPMLVQRSKGPLPRPGETWLLTQDLGMWSFAAIVASAASQFEGGGGKPGEADTIVVAPSPPASPVTGDLWMDSAGGNELFRWGGTSWIGTQFGTPALADGAVTAPKIAPGSITTQQISPHAGITAQQVAFSVTDIGGVKVTTGITPPREPNFGDIWFNPNAGNMMSIWNGSAWVPYQFGAGAIQPGSLTGAQISDAPTIGATQVSFTASDIGGVTVSIEADEPADPSVGDLWFDASSEYELKQWTGSAWAPFQFGGQAIAPDSIGTSNVNFTAREIGGITTSVGPDQPSGAVAGDLWYDAGNGFRLSQYDGTAWVPFQYGTGAIAAGSVTAALIAANTITAAQIAAGTITAAQIASATITGGNIAAGTITASNIAANTITAALIAAGTITAAQIASGTITSSQIAAGTITAKNLAVGGTVNSNPYFSGGDLTGWQAFQGTLAPVQPGGSSPYQWAAQLTPNGTGAGPSIEGGGLGGPFPVVPGLPYLVSAIVFTPAGSVTVGFDWDNAPGSYLSTSIATETVTPSAWSVVSSIQVAPAGAEFGVPRVGLAGTPPSSTTLLAEAITVLSPLNGGIIEAGTIAAAQIAAGTITATQIASGTITAAQLAAGLVVAGIIDGTVVTGATLQNSLTDPRTAIHPDGSVTITNASGTVIFRIGPDGTTDWFSAVGQLQASITPAGDFLVYQSPQGPQSWDFEPPGAPQLVTVPVSSTASVSSIASPVTVTIPAGTPVMVVASASGLMNAISCSDSQGNLYTLLNGQTANSPMQVYYCASTARALSPSGTPDSITVQFSAANTQCKNIICAMIPGLLASGAPDVIIGTNGSSGVASIIGTPTLADELAMLFISNANAGGAPGTGSQWQQLESLHTGSNQYTTVAYGSVQQPFSALTGSGTLAASVPWSVIMIVLKGPGSSSSSWFTQSATFQSTTAWSSTGEFSLSVTHSGTTQPWGVTSPMFPVTAGAPVSISAAVEAPSALTAQTSITFYNSSGTPLGTVACDQGATAIAAGASQVFTITGAIPPAGATQAALVVSSTDTTSGLVMNVDTVVAPGGLVYSSSAAGGIDIFDNPYGPGTTYIGLPLQENILQVLDPYGSALATLDSGGNLAAQQVSAAEDILLGGQSFMDTILPDLAQGIIAVGSLDGNLPAPATPVPTGTETAIMELDVPLQAGRCYMIALSGMEVQLSAPGRGQLYVRATDDGSTPSVSSAKFMSAFADAALSSRLFLVAGMVRTYQPITDQVLRMLLTFTPVSGTINGTTTNPTGQIITNADAGTFGATQQGAIVVYDLGNSVPNTGVYIGSGSSGTTGGQKLTHKASANATWAYYGANASGYIPNGLRQHNNIFYEGIVPDPGVQHGSVGNCYSYLDFTSANWPSVLAGATINSITLTLTSAGSSSAGGVDVYLGMSPNASKNSPTSGVTHIGTYSMQSGQTKAITLPNSVAAALQSGAAVSLVVGAAPSDSKAAGKFQGTGSGQGPYITVNFTT